MSRANLGRREFLRTTGLAALGAATGARVFTRQSLAAQHSGMSARKPMSDVVVLLPGITGSVLHKDNQELWGLSTGSILRAIRTLGRSINTLKLNDDPADADDLGDGITAVRLFPDTHLIPGLWKIDGYTKVTQRLEREFRMKRGENFFEFPYDWRRDNRVAARRLARQSHDWLKAWREQSGNQNAKLILMGHSMGGLVSRYFLECMDGWRDTRMLITFGTPHRGSLDALNFISNGFKKQLVGLDLVDLTDLLCSFTSVYQLLPIYPCYDPGDGTLVRVGEAAGIPGVDASRARRALEFHREIEGCVDAHLKDDAYLKDRYAIHSIVGTYQPTLQSAKLSANKVELSTTHPEYPQLDGDGRVPRPSATPIEMEGKTDVFIAQTHGSLQNADPVLVQLAGLLSGFPPGGFRDAAAVSIRVDDAYGIDESIKIRSRCQREDVQLTAVVVNVRSGREVARRRMRAGSDHEHEVEFAPLAEGAYRVTVGDRGRVDPVSDVFVVSGN